MSTEPSPRNHEEALAAETNDVDVFRLLLDRLHDNAGRTVQIVAEGMAKAGADGEKIARVVGRFTQIAVLLKEAEDLPAHHGDVVMATDPVHPPTTDEAGREALERLLRVARSDTGQARRVADFLLAWWNASTCGGWDPTDLWAVDPSLAQDMFRVLKYLHVSHAYPDTLGLKSEFDALVRAWRPRLHEKTDSSPE